MSGAVSDIGIPLRRLVAESLYQSAINALTSSLKAPLSDPKAFAALNEAFDFLEKLPLSLRRLAWLSTFGSPTHVRIIKRTLTEQLWSVGVNHGLFQRLGSPSSAVVCVAEAMAEPSGVGKLLAIVATSDQNDLSGAVAKLHNYGAFSVLCGDASSSTIAADAIHLVALKPTRPTLEALCAALGNAYSQSAAAVCAVALWISALKDPDSPQVSPPNHPTIPHLLAVSWARGIRRKSARQLGLHDGIRAREEFKSNQKKPTSLAIPRSLSVDWDETQGRRDTTNALLAPLLVEWTACVVSELEPTRDKYLRAEALNQVAPLLGERIMFAVCAHEPSARWLSAILSPLHLHASKQPTSPAINETRMT